MRTAFIDTLLERARADERVMLVVGDVGFGVVTAFQRELPGQFLNAGIAEQNMLGVAAGLALSGRIVFVYSIANFPVLRCIEQIRNDVCYHQANVKIVSVGGGLAYGALGPSHHATEDLAMMRALPNLLVTAPGDPVETRLVTGALAEHHGPAYLRIGRAGEPTVHHTPPAFQLGRAIRAREGEDVTLISTGGMLHNTVMAAGLLARQGIEARVLSMPTLKPLDEAAIRAAARETAAIFTVEEHSVVGGLGGAVAEVLLEADQRPACFLRLGIPDHFASLAGTQDYLLESYGLTAPQIAETVGKAIRRLLVRGIEAKEAAA
jgi:transketolase